MEKENEEVWIITRKHEKINKNWEKQKRKIERTGENLWKKFQKNEIKRSAGLMNQPPFYSLKSFESQTHVFN